MRRVLLLTEWLLIASPSGGFAQGDVIFADGFETGDTSAWIAGR